MASKKSSQREDYQSVVNRWVVDYYMFLALELFKEEQDEEFSGVRDVLESVLSRPCELTCAMQKEFQVLKFLSRINEGEKLDVSFEFDHSITPLESALMMLKDMNHQDYEDFSQDFEKVQTSIREMLVAILIRSDEFDKAKEVLTKHFPRPVVGKKAIFLAIIRQKSKKHKLIMQIDFPGFRKEMLAFCQKLCPFNVPFLLRTAQQFVDKRLTKTDGAEEADAAEEADGAEEVEEPDEQDDADKEDEPGPSSRLPITPVRCVPCKQTLMQRARLQAAYKDLAKGSDKRTYAQLEEELGAEERTRTCLFLRLSPSPNRDMSQASEEQDDHFQRDSGSPMEATPADQPQQTDAVSHSQAGSQSKTTSVSRNRRLYTVARLVLEPDSQVSSQYTTAPQEQEAEITTKESPQHTSAGAHKNDLQKPLTDQEVTTPKPKRPRHARRISSSSSEENPEESPVRVTRKRQGRDPVRANPGTSGDICIDESMDSQSNLLPLTAEPQTSSTPHKDSDQQTGAGQSKWKRLYDNAKESKETWSDEESHFTNRKTSGLSHNESNFSSSGQKKRMWTESETERLIEGVKKFGEGNWTRIQAYYNFTDRSNINLKDRWRTLKKLNVV